MEKQGDTYAELDTAERSIITNKDSRRFVQVGNGGLAEPRADVEKPAHGEYEMTDIGYGDVSEVEEKEPFVTKGSSQKKKANWF